MVWFRRAPRRRVSGIEDRAALRALYHHSHWAHSVPRWYEAFDRLANAGQLTQGDFADTQLRASQAAILEQEVAGIDIITGGELHRRTHNRHSPPNAMLNHFWHMIPSFQGDTKPKPITPHDPHVFHPAAICRGPILDTIDLGLVAEFQNVSAFARKPVKVSMTDPHLLAAVAYDEYYNDLPRMMADFGKLLHQNFKKLAGRRSRYRPRPLAGMRVRQAIARPRENL